LGKGAVVVVKEKRKKTSYLVSTNLHLSALDIVKYYAKRWKIEQMIKDLKQRLGFGHYQVRNPQAIQRHVALVFSSLIFGKKPILKILDFRGSFGTMEMCVHRNMFVANYLSLQ
jgi:transposase